MKILFLFIIAVFVNFVIIWCFPALSPVKSMVLATLICIPLFNIWMTETV